jgi:hypothetical protein
MNWITNWGPTYWGSSIDVYSILGTNFHIPGWLSHETRCSPRTRMLTRMLMVQMSKHMDMQSRRTLSCNSVFEVLPVWSVECGKCRVWSVFLVHIALVEGNVRKLSHRWVKKEIKGNSHPIESYGNWSSFIQNMGRETFISKAAFMH